MQDVIVLLGLRIDDCVVVSPIMSDVLSMCEKLLDMTPDDRALTGTGLRLRWLHEHFGLGPIDDITEDGVRQFA